MKTDGINSRWGRLAATAGALTLGFAGLVGASTAAAAAPGPGQANAPEQGSLTIHKYATSTPGAPGDGSQQSPDLPALAGVEFTIQEVTAVGGVVVDVADPDYWDLVSGLGADIPGNLAFGDSWEVTTGTNGSATQSDLDLGLYYVTETGAGDNAITDPVDPFLVSVPLPVAEDGWLYDVHVYPKNELAAGTASKVVNDSGAFELGDNVSWTITTPALSVRDGRELQSLTVTDQLASQLQYVPESASASVIIDGVPTAIIDPTYATIDAPTGPGGTVTIETTPAGLAYLNTLPTNATVAFTFETTVVGVGTIANRADVFVDGRTFDTGTDTTEWGAAQINKIDGASEAPLVGAVFDLYAPTADGLQPAEGVTALDTLTTGANGEIDIAGLKAGTYWVHETAAPAGYVLPTGADAWTQLVVEADATAQLEIENAQFGAPDLPMTGANGQLLMTIAGIALVLVAGGGALAVRNRSKSAE